MKRVIRDERYGRSHGWVYFIRCQEFVKIGWARMPARRLVDLQMGNPFEMWIAGVVGPTAQHPAENRLHAKFKKHWHRGEWFDWCPEIEKYVCDNAIDHQDDFLMDLRLRAVPGTKVVCVVNGESDVIAAFPERRRAEKFARNVAGRSLASLGAELDGSWLPMNLPSLLRVNTL